MESLEILDNLILREDFVDFLTFSAYNYLTDGTPRKSNL